MNIPEFKNKKILEQVFIHRSYLNETKLDIESNERLEFLGDSILSFAISSYIYKQNAHLQEGALTNLRSVLTNTQTLYEIAKMLNLGSYLKLSHGEEAGNGRENKTILADTLEALIGGIFVDQGLPAAEQFVHDAILSQKEEIIEAQGLKDAKSSLQEKLQEKYKTSPVYQILSAEGPDHAKTYIVGAFLNNKLLSQGKGKSKQEAEKAAASNALEEIQ